MAFINNKQVLMALLTKLIGNEVDGDLNVTGDLTIANDPVGTLKQVYPVGAIYMSVNNTSPASLFGGTWEQLKDRFLLGAGDTYTNGATGGEATHTLTTSEMPSHNHIVRRENQPNTPLTTGAGTGGYYWYLPNGISAGNTNSENLITTYTGGSNAHNNMPPYLVVYMWKRTA